MASLHFSTFNPLLPLLPLLLLFILPHPSHSLACKSQTFTTKQNSFSNCTDLPYLNSYLHWTYTQLNSTLSIAFTASPSKSMGWVAWGINPTRTGMFGTQALLAYRKSNDSIVVNTYNISTFDVAPGNISFPVLDPSAEYSGGNITLFANWVLPGNTTVVNYVWQVGPSVSSNGKPAKHDMLVGNKNSVGTLSLVANVSSASTASSPSSRKSSAGAPPLRVKSVGYGLLFLLLADISCFFFF